MNKMDEIIIVVKRDILFENEIFAFQGLETHKGVVNKLFNNIAKHWTAMRRGDAETNYNYKQPIPYVILRRDNEIFLYKRLVGGGEKRLHNQLSIGVGGHLNPSDHGNFKETLYENLNRELVEELIINTKSREGRTIGFINDDINDVGRVHIGLLVVQDLPKDAKVTVRETDQLEGQWVTLNELREMKDQLESWSQIALDALN